MTTDIIDRDFCIRAPATPAVFLMRAAWVELAVAVVQIVHLSFFASSNLRDFIAWAVIHIIAQLSLYFLRCSVSTCSSFTYIPWKPLAILLLLTFLAKLYSRFPYIASWLSDGLRTVRTSEELGAGSSLSAINVLFYPLGILLAVTTLPKRIYFKLMLCVVLMCFVDLIFLGKGGAPWFVLLFHFLSFPVRQVRKAHIFYVFLLFVIMIVFSIIP
ncbi:hypothetical protein [Chromobacterium vaccinii]|uniref:hypothetical protein n=1 Tax=Chromobacterium vaccinii TaxID=1108595 RepID=UPI000E1AF36F|nr:hypothetical protein [Chromobacterium vaccinii]SUX30564.1 Uncharacterised protein [Chromobacterium vaccinii]